MSNDTTGNPIILDTFSSAIDLGTLMRRTSFSVESIKWQQPTTEDHTCKITDGAGRAIFDELCVVAKDSKIQYYGGGHFNNIKIAQNGVSSGKVVIHLRVNRRA
jgi:hypothetical protein